jgi:hypothetical protein
MFEQIGEALCPPGCIAGLTRGNRVGDLSEFELDGGRESSSSVADERIEACDRAIEPLNGDHSGVTATLPIVL